MNNDFYIYNSFSKFLEIKGSDRDNFLQSLITNDIYKCKKNKAIYACLLTPQGKFIADFFIINDYDKYLLEIHQKYIDLVITKLKLYKLKSNIDLKINDEINSIILFSRNNYDFQNLISCYEDPRNSKIGKKIYLKKKDFDQFKKIEKKDFIKYKEILIKHLIPYTPDNLIENKSLLLENNFQNINAIDWNKGCYVGQEITARMQYRALLKKKIFNLKIIAGKIKIGDKVVIDKKSYGEVISIVNT